MRLAVSLIFALLLVIGCSEVSNENGTDVPDDTPEPEPTGMLEVAIQPEDAVVEIRRAVPGGFSREVVGNQTLELPVGQYEVTAEAEAFVPSQSEVVEVAENETTTHHIALEPMESLVDVTRVAASEPNSVGGVDITIAFTSESDQTIDYVRFRAEAFNAVGDRVYDDFDRSIYLLSTGPISNGERRSGTWTNVIYNFSAECFELTEVEVELRDDTVVRYDSAAELDLVMSTSNACLPQ